MDTRGYGGSRLERETGFNTNDPANRRFDLKLGGYVKPRTDGKRLEADGCPPL